MVKLTVFVEDGKAKVTLPEPSWVRSIAVKNATVFWRHRNHESTLYIETGRVKTHFPGGYLTFDEMAEIIGKTGVKLSRLSGGKCFITNGRNGTIIPPDLAKLLGFDGQKLLRASSVIVSENRVDMLNGLRYITVRCDRVNPRELDILALPVIANPAGAIERYVDVESITHTGGISATDFNLTVYDQSGLPYTDCDILMDVYVA